MMGNICSKIKQIEDYHYSSPILAKLSNERTLLKIVKLLDICIFGTVNGDDNDKMDVSDGSVDVNLRNMCNYFGVGVCNLMTLDNKTVDVLNYLGVQTFDKVVNFFNKLFVEFRVKSLDECLEQIIN